MVARDYALELPERIPGPFVHLRMRNAGSEPHYMRFLRIDGRRTLEDVAAWRKGGGPLPGWLRGAGGIGTIAPGESVEFRAIVPAGRYLVLCGHPSPDGTFHVDKGMYRIVAVGEPDPGSSRLADATIVLSDDSLTIYGLPRSGGYNFLVLNSGTGPQQALLVRLPPGVTLEEELEWFRAGSKGRRPGHPVGGVIELLPGHEARVTVDLAPGSYIVFSTVATGGRRAFDRGVLGRFEVR